MKNKSPILIYSIFIFLFGLYITFFPFWGLTIFAAIWLYGFTGGLIIISLFLKFTKFKWRTIAELIIVTVFSLFLVLHHLNWDSGSELYFNGNKTPFIGKNQQFIIIFDVKNQPKLESNTFTNNKIIIPESEILYTSSPTKDYKQSYRFIGDGRGNKFTTSRFETCQCYGKENYKFNYLLGAINDSAVISNSYKTSILEKICEKFENSEISNNLKTGYDNGSYLDQTEIFINHKGLTQFPKRLLGLKNIEYINIHSNNLKTIPNEVYEFPKLKRLTIGFNQINNIPEKIGTLKTLESLAVNGNELTDLPDTLLTLPNLKYLYVRENQFSESKQKELYDKYLNRGIELQFK